MEKIYWLHVISPLHVGAGRGIGYIDVPIVREKTTNWPYVPGSAIKGVIADSHKATKENREKDPQLAAAFGKPGDEDAVAGSLVFSDAAIVCLPVRSFYGTFAWITSPLALRRLRLFAESDFPTPKGNRLIALPGNCISSPPRENKEFKAYFEDIDLAVVEDNTLDPLCETLSQSVFSESAPWRAIFKQRFALVNDDVFTFFCDTGTEVAARIRMKEDAKVVADGALWYEESLPAETILAGAVWCDKIYGKSSSSTSSSTTTSSSTRQALTQQALMDAFCSGACDLQIGGKASIGKGRVRCVFSRG